MQKQTESCVTISHVSCNLEHNCLKLKKKLYLIREELIKKLPNLQTCSVNAV
jgi:hypothetical protein